MIVYLTSSPTGTYLNWDVKEFDGFNEENGFAGRLREELPGKVKTLVVSAAPSEYDRNDEMARDLSQRLYETGFEPTFTAICDDRHPEAVLKDINAYDLIILGGGHVPTQNAFFRRIGLPKIIQGFNGIVIGISAGTMNCAENVYSQPEEEGESLWPAEKRWLKGLGLTDINVLPHYNVTKTFMLDGKRLFEDVTYPDSFTRPLYCVTDGSYIRIEGKRATFHGEIYKIEQGLLTRI